MQATASVREHWLSHSWEVIDGLFFFGTSSSVPPNTCTVMAGLRMTTYRPGWCP